VAEPEPTLEQLLSDSANRVSAALATAGVTKAAMVEAFPNYIPIATQIATTPALFQAIRDDLAFLAWHAAQWSRHVDTRSGMLNVTYRYRKELAQAIPETALDSWVKVAVATLAIGLAAGVEILIRSRVPATPREALTMLLSRASDGDSVPIEEIKKLLNRLS